MELIELPPPFERLQHLMAEVEESRKNCTERKYLIDFVKDGFQKEKNKNLKGEYFLFRVKLNFLNKEKHTHTPMGGGDRF